MEEAEQDDNGLDHGATSIRQRDISLGRWDAEMGLAEITVKHGKLWGSMGVIRNSKLYCHVEEVVYMIEQGSLVLFRGGDDIPISRQDVYDLLVVPTYGCSWDAYQIFCHLKRLGYIVGRHGTPWSTSRSKRRPTDLMEGIEPEEENRVTPENPTPKSCAVGGNDHSNDQESFKATVLEVVEAEQSREALEYKDVDNDSLHCNSLETPKILTSTKTAPNSCDVSGDEQSYGQGNFRGAMLEGIQTGVSSPAVCCKDVDEDSLIHDKNTKGKGLACLFSDLQVSEEDLDILNKEEKGDFKLMFDVHHPNSRFKKTAPGFPAFTLCIVKGHEPPARREVCELEAIIEGRPLKFGTVDCGHVSIFSFTTCCLPTLP